MTSSKDTATGDQSADDVLSLKPNPDRWPTAPVGPQGAAAPLIRAG